MKFDLAQTFQIGILYQKNLIFLIIARVQRHSRTSLRNRYLNGPPFLYKSLESVLKFDDIKEEEKDQVENNHMNTYQRTKVTSTFPWEHCSSFTKLIQHIALMKLFVRKWIFKTQSCMKLKLTVHHSRTSLRNRYLNGPPFLYKSLESVLKFDDIKEEEKDQVENNHMNTYQRTKVTSTFPWEHCSSFTKLIQHIALMKLFVRKWIFKTQSCMKLKLTASLLQESRTAIFEFVQRENFASELKYLQVSNVVTYQNKLLQLNPILDKS